MSQGFRKGDRVEYTWSNAIIRKPPFTDTGTVLIAHRNGDVTVMWDTRRAGGSKQFCWSGMGLKRVNESDTLDRDQKEPHDPR